MTGLLNLKTAHEGASDYRAALKTPFIKAGSMSSGNQKPSTEADDIGGEIGDNHKASDTSSIHPSVREEPEQYLFSKGYQAQYDRNVRAPEKWANCAVFISSGFIESASLDRMHNQLLQPFLRSPAEYFFRGDFELLPKHFFHYNVASEYVNKIRDQVHQKGCALLVPARDQGFSTQLWQSLESIPPSLKGTELIVEPYREWLDSLLVRAPL